MRGGHQRKLRSLPPPLTLSLSPQAGRGGPPRLADVVAELALIGRNDLGPRLEAWLDGARRDGAVGAAQAADRCAARRRIGAACQDGGGRDGGPCRRRHRGGLARARPALRAAVRLARGARTEARRGRCAGLPAADAVACAGGCRLGGARRRRLCGRMEVGRHPRADRGAAAARRISSRAPATTSADSFPDVVGGLNFDAVLDGELLVVRGGEVAPFNDLQQRLNRKGVTRKQLGAVPGARPPLRCPGDRGRGPAPAAVARASRAARGLARARAAAAHRPLAAHCFPGARPRCSELWEATRENGIEGIMLKRRDSPYIAGRPKGLWWKWKRAPLTLDCVLMYAQRGSGKRSSYYSDYTFGAWRPDEGGAAELVPVGKAYFGFTDEELLADRPLGAQPHDRELRAGARRRAGPGVRGRLRCRAALDPPQVRRRHALSAHPAASAGTSPPPRPTGSRR